MLEKEHQGMICKAGILWDTAQIFHRFVEDCGVSGEVITPHLLAAPFFRGSYVALIIPTGFANRRYSLLLPALRAKKDRIRSFVERGGKLLVFGAADLRSDAYDWLPFPVEYHHSYEERTVALLNEGGLGSFLEGYDCSMIACDGIFPLHEGEAAGVTEKGEAVLIVRKVGDGLVIVTSVHEYPSKKFLKEFCCGEKEISF